MNDFDAAKALQNATNDFQKTFDQQLTLNQQTLDLNRTILQQHQIMLDVLRKYQGSRWPWVRWVADAMHEEMMYRCAVAEKIG